MPNDLLTGLQPAGGAPARKRGRPKGSGNKRSGDLRAWVIAQYGGLTSGQQAAMIGLATAREVREATPLARELGVSPVLAALMVKAKAIARHMNWSTQDAWAVMAKERAELHPFVHPRQAQAAAVEGDKGSTRPLVVLGPDFIAGDPGESQENQGFGEGLPLLVSRSKSHGEGQAPDQQGETPA